jgi:glycosyltransferase involved in cell wall biosynthesis
MKPRQVVVVDSGMRNLGGHNFSYTQAVQRAFQGRGCAVEVLANRGLASDLAERHHFRPTFSCGAYDAPLGHGRWRDLAYVHAQGRVFAEELDHALRCVLMRAPDLVFCHTVADFELLGWSRLLRRLPFPGTLAILLRQTPGFRACHWLRRTLNPYWRLKPQALTSLRGRLGRRFLFCTDSQALSEDYQTVYAGRIVTLPIPLSPELEGFTTGPLAERYGLAESRGLRVGYLGDARTSKGFDLLPNLVERVLATDAPVRFVFQCARPGSGDDHAAPPPGLSALEDLVRRYPSAVTLIPEKLSVPDYGVLVHHLDVIVLPYVSDSYREATSGIFAEALALGKPVVVPEGTWMAQELRATGAGLEFVRGSPADLATKVLAVVRDHLAYQGAAQRGSAAWRGFHNAGTLVDMLLEEAGSKARLD